ncbi:unnamed protein product [Nyctereutes procyonoides]|uniref:(raccoon dog) hypothetical protein n=1 Tax=Nyctereutes procyonoides TaxID=34880 RepID=A0A811ZLF4_NYCPR|nr:unnamed protein product [Nyctereutes procyonoides]
MHHRIYFKYNQKNTIANSGEGARLPPARAIAARRESPSAALPSAAHPRPAARTPQAPRLLPLSPRHGGIRARSSPRKAPARSPPRRSASLAPSASACARVPGAGASPSGVRGGAGERRGDEAAGRLRRRSGRRWNPRGLRSRVRPGAGGKPLALLSRDDGQILSGCLVHGFLSGARPGSLHRVESPWLILATGQWVFLRARQEPESQPASPSSSLMPAKKNVLRLQQEQLYHKAIIPDACGKVMLLKYHQ